MEYDSIHYEMLYDFIVKLYKDPMYSESSEGKTKNMEQFVSTGEEEIPLYVWKHLSYQKKPVLLFLRLQDHIY